MKNFLLCPCSTPFISVHIYVYVSSLALFLPPTFKKHGINRQFQLYKHTLHIIYNGPTNALVCNKTLIQMSHTKTSKITLTCFDHQMIIIRELFDPG
jgi:hypothetical protein